MRKDAAERVLRTTTTNTKAPQDARQSRHSEIVILFGLARRTGRQIEKVSLFYQIEASTGYIKAEIVADDALRSLRLEQT